MTILTSKLHTPTNCNCKPTDRTGLERFVTPYEKRSYCVSRTCALISRHQAHAHRDGASIHFLLSDIQNGVWHYRRDPTISAVTSRINLKTDDGIPYLAPEIVLLFKSRNTSDRERGKDEKF